VRRLWLSALALTILVPLLAVMLVLAAVSASQVQCGGAFAAAGSGPVGGVPAALVPLFQGAAARYQLGPHGASILAAINYVESTFGQSNLAGVHSGANYAGAEGPMQFLAGTWQTEAVNAPGDPAGQPPNVYDEADAVYSGAHYLHDLGMAANPSSWPGAIFGYNHSLAYVQQVLARANTYYTQGLATQSTGGSGLPMTRTGPIKVPPASGDPAGPARLAQGQPAFVAATVFSDATGAWGDNLALNTDSYAELSPGLSGSQVSKQTADMLGDLPYMTALQVINPANGRSVILDKRDIGAGQPLSHTLHGYHYRIDLTHAAETQLGLSGSAIVQVTRLAGPVNGPGAAQACTAPIALSAYVNPFAHATGIVPQRIDQGVDYDGTGPVAAIGDATIMHISTAGAMGWPGYYYIAYQLDNGPDQRNWVYVAEDITPTPGLHVGQQLSAGQPIATFAYPQNNGIETGWAQPDAANPQPIAQLDGGYGEGQRTAAGDNFSALLAATGAPPGNVDDPPGHYRPTVGHYP
jgi:hypothetical protein